MRELTIGLLQIPSSNFLDDSVDVLNRFSKKIRNANIVILPEYAMIDPTELTSHELLNVAESLDNPGIWLKTLFRVAKEKNICLIGTLFTKGKKKARNTVVLINDRGEIISHYNKTHLFDAFGFKESDKFESGDSLFKPTRLCNAKIGLAVCFELRFPEIFRYEALEGSDIIVVPAAWYRGPLKEAMLEFLARSRAHENTLFLALSALSGERFTGGSMIVDPLGYVTLNVGPQPNYMETTIDLDRILEVRKYLPLLKLRRKELYYK